MVISDEWHRLEKEGLWIPVRAVPKERPQIGSKGAYYSDRYTSFRQAVAQHLARSGPLPDQLSNPVSLEASFQTEGFHLQLRPLLGWNGGASVVRPKHVRGDLDNLIGGVMDALQDAGVLANDSWVMETHARCWADEEDGDE